MWLIETRTLRLKFVTDARHEERPYAILSHTWVDGEEVTFQEFQDPERARAERPAGYAKIAKTCELALREEPPLEYCWVDTCCIDKTSSAELTEAINSMFRWYKHSAVCYAFLSDLEHSRNTRQEDLAPCRWFTRGWTLQELVAPRVMAFFDKEWRFRGTKRKLRTVLGEITGIPTSVLGDCDEVFGECIARRMSWAASRQTTRVEDKAYCLLGIFGVYMPMIYGEGGQAFVRLQEELIKGNHDRSLFAWRAPAAAAAAAVATPEGGQDQSESYRGILAHDAGEFAHCGRYGRLQAAYRSNSDFVLTNRGVRFEGFLPLSLHGRVGYLLDLECCDYIDVDVEDNDEDDHGHDGGGSSGKNNKKKTKTKTKKKTSWVGILLEKTGKNGFVRSEPRSLRFFDRFLDDQWYPSYLATPRYFVARDLHARDARAIARQYALSVQVRLPRQHVEIVSVAPEELWDPAQRLFWTLGADTFIGCLVLRVNDGLGFSRQCLLVCGTRRAGRADRQDGSDAGGGGGGGGQAKTATGPAGIDGRIPWCYTLDGRGMAQVRLYTGNDHGGGGDDGSARRTEYYNDDLIRSHNFLSQLWRAIPDPKPAAHETSWDRAEAAGPRPLRYGVEVTTSVARFREQDTFRVDVSTWGEGLGSHGGDKGGAELAVVVHTPIDDGGGGSGGIGAAPRMLPVRFRHVAGRSVSRSPPGDKEKTWHSQEWQGRSS